MSSQPATVFATFHPHPEHAARLREILGMMLVHTRNEPGCQRYDLYRSAGDGPPTFHLFERYDDADALAAHRASEHYQRYRAALPDLLASPVDVAVLAEDDVSSPGSPTADRSTP